MQLLAALAIHDIEHDVAALTEPGSEPQDAADYQSDCYRYRYLNHHYPPLAQEHWQQVLQHSCQV